jgi:hypothetical protein
MEVTMKTAQFTPSDVLQPFSRKKALTKAELLQTCGCSAMTAWRILYQQGYFTSYNHNAKYYTLASIPQFDEQGLWACRDIRFSKWGTLPETVVAQIGLSFAGMTARELEELLHVPNVKPTLTHLTRQGRLQRTKIAGALVYFAGEPSRHQQQLQRRETETATKRRAEPLPDPHRLIALLVEMIRHPQQTPRQWARRLACQGIRLRTPEIQAVLDHYQLSVKKGLSSS